MKIPDTLGSLLLQSDNFPKNEVLAKSLFSFISLAFLAALGARQTKIALFKTVRDYLGFSIKNVSKPSKNTLLASFLTSEFPNLPFVCPSNCGLGCLQEIIIVNLSLTSSLVKGSSF